jgi:hypothetical protein
MNDQTLFADGYDEAIIGYQASSPARVIYSANKMVEIFVRDNEATEEEAYEFLSYNTWNAYVGEGTPIYLWEANRQEIEYFVIEDE